VTGVHTFNYHLWLAHGLRNSSSIATLFCDSEIQT
jgi:hypothetical protein